MATDRHTPARAWSALRHARYRVLTVVLAIVGGLAVFVIAVRLFPYHSANMDEGVYLQQAAMLLDGRLFLTPESAAIREAVHPWFFVAGERGLYAKYSPVPGAVFALGRLAGGYRLSLAALAAGNVALVAAVTTEAFDRRTGTLAAAILVGAPLFVVTSAVFLPYAPTTLFNLLFAFAYIRSVRRESLPYAALAGMASGLAFFARPYTAVLFAAPFIAHAGLTLIRAEPTESGTFRRTAVTAGLGLLLVGVTLAYNAVMTGSPLLFPYEAFAPRDGIGFGRRRILGHELRYTPGLAIRANARVVWTLITRWFTAGILGSALAVLGVVAVLAGVRREGLGDVRSGRLADRTVQVLLLGILVTVVVGNVFFWGNRNLLGRLSVAGDGLIGLVGPVYHFDLLLPLSALAAHGALSSLDRIRAWATDHVDPTTIKVAAVVALAVSLPLVGAAEASVLGPPVERNAAHTERYATVYEPFRPTPPTDALVFVPPTNGEWRNQPFQWLRNEPDLAGPTVYALDRGPAADFAVIDAYPDRTYHRFRYHGVWTPAPDDPVVPVLEAVELRTEEDLAARTAVTVPDRVTGATVTVTNGRTTSRLTYDGDPPPVIVVDWTLSPAGVMVGGPNLSAPETAGEPVPIDGADELVLTISVREPSGATLTFREAVTVRATGTDVQAVWPPVSSVCPLVTACGTEGTYVPGRPDTRPANVTMTTTRREGKP